MHQIAHAELDRFQLPRSFSDRAEDTQVEHLGLWIAFSVRRPKPLVTWTASDYMLSMMASTEHHQNLLRAKATRDLSPSKHRDDRHDIH